MPSSFLVTQSPFSPLIASIAAWLATEPLNSVIARSGSSEVTSLPPERFALPARFVERLSSCVLSAPVSRPASPAATASGRVVFVPVLLATVLVEAV